jgi:hypothetical protein
MELFVPSTRRNAGKNPWMIDPDAPYELRERRVMLEEMLRCAVDPDRATRPVVKFNLSGLQVKNPVRRSKLATYQRWARAGQKPRQMRWPVCDRCGGVHDRYYEMLPGEGDYRTHCQRCDDELAVEALWRHRGIFGGDDPESILDRLYRSQRELFERGVLPDYWYKLRERSG